MANGKLNFSFDWKRDGKKLILLVILLLVLAIVWIRVFSINGLFGGAKKNTIKPKTTPESIINIPKKEDVDMERLVEDVVCFMDLEARGLRIERLYSACPCRVKADPELMRQLFLNLLKNAQEAQPGGGFLRIQLEQRDGGVEIVFENGGELPDPGIKERLLEPYFTTKTSGSGIGLPFSKRIVEAHGGHLEVRIESGTFRVTLWLPG